MRRGGIVTARRRLRERGRRIRRCAMAAGLVLLLCAMAISDQLKDRISVLMNSGASMVGAVMAVKADTVELTLDEIEVYALQLGVFDSGERALGEQRRLAARGTPCVIWQRDKMRLICSVAMSREELDSAAAGGNEAYIIRETLPRVRLRLSCAAEECDDAAAFAMLCDTVLTELLSQGGRSLEEILTQTRALAQNALAAYSESVLYTELAKSLCSWCDAVEADEQASRCYAAVLMCSICREWRNALVQAYSVSDESTASAQRTPSTAADVMPPA